MKGMKGFVVQFILFVFLFLVCTGFDNDKQSTKIILLPDTQGYAEKFPEILHRQVDWILENSKDIDFVLQQGDLTNNNNDREWEHVKSAFGKLDNKVPYVLAIGNHDMGSKPGVFADNRNTANFNKYFPVDKMKNLPGFGGIFHEGEMENSWYLFETGKQKWLVLNLEFGPRDEVLKWAGKLAQQYNDRLVILNTHCYLYSDSTCVGAGDKWNPRGYGIGKNAPEGEVNDGEQIWEKLVKSHPNIRFVFSGHILNGGVGTLISTNEKGLPVYQFLANYQGGVQGSVKEGNGFLRILEIDAAKKSLRVKTYSPFIDEYKTSGDQDFEFDGISLEPK